MFNKLKLQNWRDLKTWRPYLIIFIIGFLLYGQTLLFRFSYLDDNILVLQNAPILENVGNIGKIFSTDVFMSSSRFYYRPLLNLSFMVDAHLGGVLPFFYHLSNILLHLIATGLVFYLLYYLIKKKTLAFLLSLIFLVHPVLNQAVAWVPGRNDSLLAIFVLASFIFFLKFLEQSKWSSYLAYLLFLFLALLTKETAVVLPLMVIIYFWLIDCGKSLKNDRFLVIFGSLSVGFIWFLMRSFALGGEPVNYFNTLVGGIANLPSILVDLGKLFFPVNLAVLPILKDSTPIYGFLTLGLLIFFWIISKQKRNNYVVFGSLWFLLFLFPSLIKLSSSSYFLEQRLYLPLFGFLLVLAEIDWIKNLNFNRRSVKIGSVTILLILTIMTFFHSQNFCNRLVFWQSAVRTSPHLSLAQKNLGVMEYFNGNYLQAEKHYNLALELDDQEIMVHNNLGVIYMNQKKYEQARQEFNEELKINPGYDKTLNNLQTLSYYQNKLK
jgi:tetratricopeptide (TPR) repeat protein